VRLAHRFTGNETDALDVLQETFSYLLRKVPRLRVDGRMTTLLYPVVKNLAIAANRKRRRSSGGGEALEQLVATESIMPDREPLGTLVASLPEGQREVLLMRFVDDLQLDEIAAALGIPLGTVKSRLHHAIAALRSDPRTQTLLGP
jgi:RNA polymerase sigma-70 factor (ECF subfamily)